MSKGRIFSGVCSCQEDLFGNYMGGARKLGEITA